MSAVSDSGQAGANVELSVQITPEMVEAGVRELAGKHYGEPHAEIVTDVFIAMLWAMRPNE